MDNTLPKLMAVHPLLFEGRRQPDGFLPPGWYGLAHELCNEIENVLGDQAPALTIWTIKSKFGQLRVKVSLALPEPPGEPLKPVVRAHAGSHSMTSEGPQPLSRAVEDLIAVAMERSTCLCLWCGAPSQLLLDGGWVYAACPAHTKPDSITVVEYERRSKAKLKSKQGDDDAD